MSADGCFIIIDWKFNLTFTVGIHCFAVNKNSYRKEINLISGMDKLEKPERKEWVEERSGFLPEMQWVSGDEV